VEIISGALFLFLGLTAFGIAGIRRRSGAIILFWLGLWSAMYGTEHLVYPLIELARLPQVFRVAASYLDVLTTYLVLVVATRAWLELTVGKARLFIWAVICMGLAIAVAGIAFFLFTGQAHKFAPYNNLLAVCSTSALLIVVSVPKLSRKCLVIPNSKILFTGTFIFNLQALNSNIRGSLGYATRPIWDSLGFAVFLLSIGYVALQMVFASERRLLSVEKELAIARDIQLSILPHVNPEIENLAIAAAYHPMTEVAGDFYDFIPIDRHRMGVLIADVSGHGVPAALIAAMLKAAKQSVSPCAHDPREVMKRLNRTVYGQSPDQFVTAAYLFLDTQNHTARYSAAGHPPLLLSRGGTLRRIESNGLVLGVMPQPDYPVLEIPIFPGDRLLLYTDGVVEPENAKGTPFGDSRLERVLLEAQMCSPSELTDRLLTEIRCWQARSKTQQDDITVIVIDVSHIESQGHPMPKDPFSICPRQLATSH
jgi:sigma-B regulation protein RsbU (phosphoserine phosphatase)